MFGFIRPYEKDLTEDEKERYRSLYCGLCRELNDSYGTAGRLCLNNDMTFLTMLLGSLYEPEEQKTQTVCPLHPFKRHPETKTAFTRYAADMTIVLAYYKAEDDWADEKKAAGKQYARVLRKSYQTVRDKWPLVCQTVDACISSIREIETDDHAQPEKAANYSGKMLSSVFAVKNDYFRQQMGDLGFYLGKFIYMMDAAVDYRRDKKKGCYNPLQRMGVMPEEAREIIRQPLGQAADIFETLPLVQDVNIMRNILYSGVWQQYNRQLEKQAGDRHGQ